MNNPIAMKAFLNNVRHGNFEGKGYILVGEDYSAYNIVGDVLVDVAVLDADRYDMNEAATLAKAYVGMYAVHVADAVVNVLKGL